MKRLLLGLASAIATLLPYAGKADPEMRPIGNGLYETTIGELVKNPEWMRKSYTFVHEEEHIGEVQTPSGGRVEYKLISHFSPGQDELVRDRFGLFLESDDASPEENAVLQALSAAAGSKQRISGWRRYIERNRQTLEQLNARLDDSISAELDRYDSWVTDMEGFRPVLLNDFNPGAAEREGNDVDAYLERTIETDPTPGLYFTGDDAEVARRFLQREVEGSNIDLVSFSARGAVDFLSEIFSSTFRYREFDERGRLVATTEPQPFEGFQRSGGGNCTDFGYTATRLFNLMKETNPKLANSHLIPTFVYRYDGGQLRAHLLNTLWQTDQGVYVFVDFSDGNPADTPTMVFR